MILSSEYTVWSGKQSCTSATHRLTVVEGMPWESNIPEVAVTHAPNTKAQHAGKEENKGLHNSMRRPKPTHV